MTSSMSLDSILKPMDSAVLAHQNSWGEIETEASVPLTRQEPSFLLSAKKALAAKKATHASAASLKAALHVTPKPKAEGKSCVSLSFIRVPQSRLNHLPLTRTPKEISVPPKPTVQEPQPEIPPFTTQNAPFKASGVDIEILLRENDLLDRRNRILEGEIAAMSHQFTQQKESCKSLPIHDLI